MALKLNFASLSLGASVDQQTGHMSVFDVVEELRVPQLPVHLQSLVISIILENTKREPFKGSVFIHIITPDGKQSMVGNGAMDIPADQKRMKAVFRFGGFPIVQFGDHRIVVSWLNEQSVKVGEALMDFGVVQVTQVAQGAPPSDKPPMSH